MLAGAINGFLATKGRLPSFVVTLGMFYIARGLGAWLAAGRQLQGFPKSFNLIGRKLVDVLGYFGVAPARGSFWYPLAAAVSTQTLILAVLALVFGLILWRTPFGYMVRATGGNRRAAGFAGINTDRVRFLSLVLSRRLRLARGRDLHRLLPLLPAARGPAARARRDRLGDHRRRQHLRRLRLGPGRARRVLP